MCRALTLAALAVVLAAALAGCGDGDGDTSLEGTAWVLTGGVSVPLDVAATSPTAGFTADEVAGTTGCNRYAGGYAVEGTSIEFQALAQTNVGCPAPAGVVEREFVDALSRVETFELDGDDLVLGDADGAELLRFEPAASS